MEDFGEAEIQFNLLAVCKSPLIKIKADFADNALTLRAIKDALDRKKPDWLDFIPEDALHNHVYDTDNSFGLTEDIFAAAKADAKILKEIRKANITAERLLELFTETSYQQKQIKKDDVGERGSIMEDNQTATARRTDLTPLINTWIAKLAEEGLMQELCEKHAKQRDFSP